MWSTYITCKETQCNRQYLIIDAPPWISNKLIIPYTTIFCWIHQLLNIFFIAKFYSIVEDRKMTCTQGRLDYDWIYSLKILAHFRSKVLENFRHYVTQINYLTGAIISETYIRHILRMNIFNDYTILHSMLLYFAAYSYNFRPSPTSHPPSVCTYSLAYFQKGKSTVLTNFGEF